MKPNRVFRTWIGLQDSPNDRDVRKALLERTLGTTKLRLTVGTRTVDYERAF